MDRVVSSDPRVIGLHSFRKPSFKFKRRGFFFFCLFFFFDEIPSFAGIQRESSEEIVTNQMFLRNNLPPVVLLRNPRWAAKGLRPRMFTNQKRERVCEVL